MHAAIELTKKQLNALAKINKVVEEEYLNDPALTIVRRTIGGLYDDRPELQASIGTIEVSIYIGVSGAESWDCAHVHLFVSKHGAVRTTVSFMPKNKGDKWGKKKLTGRAAILAAKNYPEWFGYIRK